MATFVERMMGAATLRVATYEEVENDSTATVQALAVVLLASLAAAIGTARHSGTQGFFGGLVAALAGWIVWAFVTYVIGARLLPEPQTRANMGQMLRTIGFAQSPGILQLLGGIPTLGVVLLFIVQIWMLIAFVIAVRQALDYTSTGRAVAVCLLGFIARVIVGALIMMLFHINPGNLGTISG